MHGMMMTVLGQHASKLLHDCMFHLLVFTTHQLSICPASALNLLLWCPEIKGPNYHRSFKYRRQLQQMYNGHHEDACMHDDTQHAVDVCYYLFITGPSPVRSTALIPRTIKKHKLTAAFGNS
jgi:hypothetical protein